MDDNERVKELEKEVEELNAEVIRKDDEIDRLMRIINDSKNLADEVEEYLSSALDKVVEVRDDLKNV